MQVMLRVGNLFRIYCKSILPAAKIEKTEQELLSTYLNLLSLPVLLCYVML